jgi:uncharacterized protein (TIGR00369 family)
MSTFEPTDSLNESENPAPGGAAPESWGTPHTKQISWFWAGGALAVAPQTAGLDYVRGVMDGTYPPPPIQSHIPMRIVDADSGTVTLRCRPDESLLNTNGTVHGGVLATLMDTAMGIALVTKVTVAQPYATIEMKVSYLKPMAYDGSEVVAVGNVLRVGRKVAFAEAHAYNAGGDLIGHASSSLARIGD